MRQTYCNPLDLGYRYQHMKEGPRVAGFREGADPTLVYFKGKYYLFVSMSAGFWYSEDLLNWDFHADPGLLIYDYAPDVRQVGNYLYFCASRKGRNCPILRTADPLTEPFTEVSAPFAFWDPDLFCDDDGRVYFYWGCSNISPIYGVELNPDTMTPIGEKQELIFGNETVLGYERPGNNGIVDREASVLYQSMKQFYDPKTGKLNLPPQMANIPGLSVESLTAMFNAIGKPYIEGAFMTKHDGLYYLQYACPGTQYNTYADGVYTSRSPLGPFVRQASNPFSAKPGGFITGAGHGSTIADTYGNWWHASTMRISVNYDFERRVGLFPAGFDKDGVLYCNQNFADYPHRIPADRFDAARQQPEWMLLSYKKPVTASSTAENSSPEWAVNEDCRSWWSAAGAEPGEWLCVDLGKESDVRAIQVNMADEKLVVDFPPHRDPAPDLPLHGGDQCERSELDAARKCCPRVLQRLLRICRRHPCPVRPGDGRRTALRTGAAHQRPAGVRQRRGRKARAGRSRRGSRGCTGCKDHLAAHRKCTGLQCPLRRCARQALSELAGV